MREAISVGSVDDKNKLADFSNIGPSQYPDAKNIIKPDIVAPGVGIMSSAASDEVDYRYVNGTSMSASVVSGVAALIKSANKNLSVDEIEKIIKDSATEVRDKEFSSYPNFGYGYGIINAYNAVSMALGKPIYKLKGKIETNINGENAKITNLDNGVYTFADENGDFNIKIPERKKWMEFTNRS